MRIETTSEPSPGANEVLVRVEAVGLCGSDYHLFLGDHPYARFPQTQGHEIAGIVEEIGSGYDGGDLVGMRVAVEPLLPCGACYACRRGHVNCCASLKVLGAHVPGGLAEKIVVAANSIYPVGDIDAEVAALTEPISIGVQAVNRADVRKDDTVVVFGAGPIGQAVVLEAVDREARVLVADRIANRLPIATRLGAAAVVNTTEVDLTDAITEWSRGEGAAVVVDTTGAPELIRLAVDVVAPSGTVVIVGISPREVSLPIIDFTRKELNVLGSRNNEGVFEHAVDLVRRNAETVRSLITHRYALDEIPDAIRFAIAHPELLEKAVVIF
jgi:threonine dehydrogenase-like Zn-dependent dehydrogenase